MIMDPRQPYKDRQHIPVTTGRFQCLLPVDSAARYLGVSRAAIERLVYRGELPAVKIGRSIRFDVRDLDRFIETNRRRNRNREGVTLRDLIERKGEGS